MHTLDDVKRKYLDVLYLSDRTGSHIRHKVSLDIISDEIEIAKGNSNLVDFEDMMKRLEEIESGMN